jgi:xanthine dehydrogenase accessory factor
MKKQLSVWKLIDESLKKNIPISLLYVLESTGSSPGRQGFFMTVNAEGEMEGSIGGGIMEHKFVEMARQNIEQGTRLRSGFGGQAGNEEPGTVRKQYHDKSAAKDQSGMICSGEQTIWLYPVQKKDQNAIETLIYSLEKNQNGTLILTPSGISFEKKLPEKNFEFDFKCEADWIFKEKTGYKNQLSIIGGGHCALAFSKLMSEMDFYIRLYDDREHLKTMEENKFAHEKYVVSGYEEVKQKIQPGDDHYVVIMTFGYRTDDIALRALIEKDFKYLGLLGSKSKITKMFDDYRKEGIAGDLLERVHTPLGLPIKSQTPEEIAVSKIKNQNL